MIYSRLLNMELVLSRKPSSKSGAPREMLGLPVEEMQSGIAAPDVSSSEDDNSPPSPEHGEREDIEVPLDEEVQCKGYPPAVGVQCGSLPATSALHDFLGLPCNLGRRSAESHYAEEYVRRAQESRTDVASLPARRDCVLSDGQDESTWRHWSAAAIKAKETLQKAYFQQLDSDEVMFVPTEAPQTFEQAQRCNDPLAEVKQEIRRGMTELAEMPAMRQPSHTVVLEAAAFLLQRGVLSIRRLGKTNTKQGRALMIWASWLQHRKSLEWVAERKIDRAGIIVVPECLKQLEMILIGGPGTGKTTTIMVEEALLDFFYESGAMGKAAPTNTAARLLGGDTLHALYKLPMGTLHGKRGKLSAPVLKRYKKRWEGKRAHVIDEISMVMPNNFYQVEVRSRTATGNIEERFGGLATELCGDFLQLPPVDGPSLAFKWEDIQRLRSQIDDDRPPQKKQAPRLAQT